METAANIFLQMNAHQMHFLFRPADIFLRILRVSERMEGDRSVSAQRRIVLRNLIVLWHVGIEIVLAIELRALRQLASQHKSR